jgi:[amino group carrier protein]-lysine/ornithine hydrolase
MVANPAMATEGQEEQGKLARPDSVDEGRINLIQRVISAHSPSGIEGDVAKMIKDELISKRLPARIDSAGNVLCEIGSGPPGLLLCGHMDTVPGELPTKREGDLIFGRGACDAKGALLSLLFAFEDLAMDESVWQKGRLIFAGVTQEELSSAGLIELINGKMRADYAIFGEPGGISKVTVGYRGHVTTRLEIVTPEVHASAPKLALNSAEVFFEIYNDIKQQLNAAATDSTDSISASVTELSSGTAHNVIPGKTLATIDIRIPIGKSSKEVKDEVQGVIAQVREKYTETRLLLSFDEPTEPYRVRLDSPLVRAINRSLLKSGEKMTPISKSGTGDMNTYALAFSVDAITYGPGEARLSHTSEERVSISEIIGCSKIIAATANELFSMIQNRSSQGERN